MRQGQKKQDGNHACRDDGRGDLAQRDAAGFERNQLIGVVEHAQGDDARKQHADRAHLLDNKGNVEDEKLENEPRRLALFKEVVDFFEKIDEEIEGNERGKKHAEVAQKMPKDIAMKKHDMLES